jgi:hypothetical protein
MVIDHYFQPQCRRHEFRFILAHSLQRPLSAATAPVWRRQLAQRLSQHGHAAPQGWQPLRKERPQPRGRTGTVPVRATRRRRAHPTIPRGATGVGSSHSAANFIPLCRKSDSNFGRARPLHLLLWRWKGAIMATFEKICVASACTGFVVLVGATAALFFAS